MSSCIATHESFDRNSQSTYHICLVEGNCDQPFKMQDRGLIFHLIHFLLLLIEPLAALKVLDLQHCVVCTWF